MIKLIASDRRRIAVTGLAALFTVAMSLPQPASARDGPSYVLFAPGSESTSMSGSTDDLRHARELRRGSEALLYIRQDGAAYVIRDPATLSAAKAIFAPQEALGDQQAALGDRQAALGDRQAALGDQQADLGARQADATPREAAALAAQQAELGRRQGELGNQQGALGQQQAALGREQARQARIANDKIQALLTDAVRRGLAQRVD